MPARFLKTAYEPPHNGLVEMRKRGLPWLAASSILIIVVLVASVSYLFMRDQQRGFLDKDSLFSSSAEERNRSSENPEEAKIAPLEAITITLPTMATISDDIEATESKPPNPLELESEEAEEEDEREEEVESSTAMVEEATSAIPWVDESTPSEEKEEESGGVEEIEEQVEVTIAVPIPADHSDSSEEEPMRGDYPDDFHRRTEKITTTPLPSTVATGVVIPSSSSSPSTTSSASTTSTSVSTLAPSPPSSAPPRSPLLPISEFTRAAITATNEICADIARNILMAGGNAVDASIAGAFCLGGVEPAAGGLGGGMIMTVFQKATGRCEVVNGREAAPMRVETAEWQKNPRLRENGYTSIAVPGALHGLLSAYRRFRSSRVEWAELIQPTIQLVEAGFPVSPSLAEAVNYRAAEINETAGMRDIFLPTGVPIKTGDVLRDARLADTLRKIASSRDPSHLFYRGEPAERIVHEIKAKGGHIAKSDLVLFSSSIEDALTVDMENGSRICGPSPPSSFAALQAGIKIMEALNVSSSTSEELFTHYLIEATKIALNLREELGDSVSSDLLSNLTSPSFIESLAAEIGETATRRDRVLPSVSDISTSHLNVVDDQGNAVALTMGLNRPFGALRRSESLGFVWNNALSAFSHSSDHPNGFHPKKRPMSGAIPFVVVEKKSGEVELVGGATHDSSSFSALLSTLSRLILRADHLDESIVAPRIDVESGAFESDALVLIRALSARGHSSLSPLLGRSSGGATPLVKRMSDGRLLAVCDPRGRVDRCARGI
ncbi:hypothetical protein PMAYCL1PPCAC_30267 [Pristionchus mayeri]|uniref:Gamma-glutamyltranspeptidase n=1 Tax=Pristionchus mayeri TaxID=1317129 RepID=A0AAN5IBK4_9BILA|nr:hypothetical protein PMAYCL1PPCAC_30267 [Pristionchus mayeri]